MLDLPDTPVALISAEDRIAVGRPRPKLTPEDVVRLEEEEKDKARYKIEVFLSSKRSSLGHKPFAAMLLIWESGKRFHGGGDEKMYWCGYPDCGRAIPTSDFGYAHVVCRHCHRELFLDPDSKKEHVKYLHKEGKSSDQIEKLPSVVGEKLVNLPVQKLAALIAKSWYDLGGSADVYFKYSPLDIRYDSKFETASDMNKLDRVRLEKKPGIYTLKAIRRDIANGSDLEGRFRAMLVA